MKASESIKQICEGLTKANDMLNESELQRPPYLAPLVSVMMLGEATAALAREVDELKQAFDESIITTAAYFLRVEQSLEAIRQAFEESKYVKGK